MCELASKDLFFNPNIDYLFNQDIYEYDMQDAGHSLTKEYHLVSDNVLDKFNKMAKDKRKIEEGKYQRDNKDYKEKLKKAFVKAREEFILSNELDESDIISIKKDAIFTKSNCKHTKFGKYINFREKNHYTSYIKLSKKIELYYENKSIDIKGISDDKIELHEDFMISFLVKFFIMMEEGNDIETIEFVTRFIDKYKRGDLELGYYRTFDARSIIDVEDPSIDTNLYVFRKGIDNINIMYNLREVLLRLVKIPL